MCQALLQAPSAQLERDSSRSCILHSRRNRCEHMLTCIHMHTYTLSSMHTHSFTYTHTHTHTYFLTHAHTHTHTYSGTCLHVCINTSCMDTYTYSCLYILSHIRVNTYIPTLMHTYTSSNTARFNLFYLMAHNKLITKILQHTKIFFFQSDKKIAIILIHSHWTAVIVVSAVVGFLFANQRENKSV